MLRGQRVVLRAMERDDLQGWHELLSREVDLVSLGMGSWQPLPLAARVKSFEQRLENEEQSWFVIEAGGKVIGNAGLHYWNWNRRAGVAPLGISIFDPEYLGRGYGREALELLLDWAFRMENWRKLWLETLASNQRAVRAYRACGFVEEGLLRQHDYHDGTYHDIVVMGLLRTEWEAGRSPSEHNPASDDAVAKERS